MIVERKTEKKIAATLERQEEFRSGSFFPAERTSARLFDPRIAELQTASYVYAAIVCELDNAVYTNAM